MFYDKEIKLYTNTGHFNESKLWIDGEDVYLKTIQADVQPYNKALAYKDFGYDIECSKRVFCVPDDDIKMGVTIEYNGAKYKVVKLIKWDDYLDVILDG